MDDIANLNADDDLELLGIRGFAPFFARIDVSKGSGKVYVAETTQSIILTDATTTVEQHFHARGFLAKSVVTVTYENVTTQSNQVSFKITHYRWSKKLISFKRIKISLVIL